MKYILLSLSILTIQAQTITIIHRDIDIIIQCDNDITEKIKSQVQTALETFDEEYYDEEDADNPYILKNYLIETVNISENDLVVKSRHTDYTESRLNPTVNDLG